jgi:hypothetical protein
LVGFGLVWFGLVDWWVVVVCLCVALVLVLMNYMPDKGVQFCGLVRSIVEIA